MTNPAPFISLENVSFAYGKRPVLEGINLQAQRGQVVGLMGGSGSGKTTTLRLIGRQVIASSGSVKIDTQEIRDLQTDDLYILRRKMGMLFQQGALFTDLSVFENVAFPLREHTQFPENVIRDLVMMKLEAVGLRGAAKLSPGSLSGGMARRVALARAIALDPEIMMYDEPFAGLDPISLAVIANLIRKLNDVLGTTSLIVTHDVQESLKIVDYVYFIAKGKVVAEGNPEQIRASSLPYVRQFLNAEIDGPVPFHYPAGELERDFGLAN